MIRNYVFDMGMVLLNFQPMRVCEHYLQDPREQNLVMSAVFKSPEWKLLDAAALPEAEAVAIMQSRMPNVRLRTAVKDCMENWFELALSPVPGIEALLRELKEKGNRLYVLSNVAIRMREHAELIPAHELFDGMIFSAEESCVKPNPEIYRRLFERYSLEPKESFFVDDVAANIEGGEKLGMRGYRFYDGNVERLREVLLHASQYQAFATLKKEASEE